MGRGKMNAWARQILAWSALVQVVPLFCGESTVQGQVAFEVAAAKLQEVTLTVRVKEMKHEGPTAGTTSVSVFTGVSITENYIVAPIYRATDQHVDITLSGGQQLEGITEVLDEYSGLALISVKDSKLPHLEFATDLPKVGSWVASGSAWGVEKPVVSYGIISGVNRRLAGSILPPLLMCDLRWTETSNGSAVVNPAGHLLGIVVASTNPHRRGWTYAVPVKNVKALLYSRFAYHRVDENGQDVQGSENRLVVLPRGRPIVGMELSHDDEGIVVSRIAEQGPADLAGLVVGDRVIAVDDVEIRNMYQAVLQTMSRQPGDKVRFRVKRESGESEHAVVLGGGVPFPKDLVSNMSPAVQAKVDRTSEDLTREIDHERPTEDTLTGVQRDVQGGIEVVEKENIRLLTRALEEYQTTIVLQKNQLEYQSTELDQALRRIDELQRQIESESGITEPAQGDAKR